MTAEDAKYAEVSRGRVFAMRTLAIGDIHGCNTALRECFAFRCIQHIRRLLKALQ